MDQARNSEILCSGFYKTLTPIASESLVGLDSKECLTELGRFAEALVFNDSVVIPINGPALEVVVLLRWLGSDSLERLLDDGALRFAFCPGTIAFVSERNKKALASRMGPGLEHFVGETNEWSGVWDEIEESVAFVLHKQLKYKKKSLMKLSSKIAGNTINVPPEENYRSAMQLAYKDALKLYGKKYGVLNQEDWKWLDHESDRIEVQSLLEVARANLDLLIASRAGCTEISGNDTTWKVLELKAGLGLKSGWDKVKAVGKILEFEDVPDISTMVSQGLGSDEIVKMRRSADARRFRQWLHRLPHDASDLETIKAYYRSFKKNRSDSFPVKVIRLGVLTVLGLLNPAAGIGTSAVDTFWIDRFINGWNPRVFIDKYFKYRDKTGVVL